MNTLFSLVCVIFLMVVTGHEDESTAFNETDVSLILYESNSNSPGYSAVTDHSRVDSTFTGSFIGVAAGPSEENSTRKRTPTPENANDITTNIPTVVPREGNKLKSEDEINLENEPELFEKRAASQRNSSKNIVYIGDDLIVLNETETNSPKSLKTVSNSEFLNKHFEDEIMYSDSQDPANDDEMDLNVTTSTKEIYHGDISILFVEDDELNKTLIDSWNETEHFLSSGDLQVGNNAIMLLQKYIEKRKTWLRSIKHVSLKCNNTETLLIDGTLFENRKTELKEIVYYFKKLRNIYKLARFVSSMHEYEEKGSSYMRNKSVDIGSWISEAEMYLKNFENALHDLENIWKEYNVSGQFMFPWDRSYGLISKTHSSLAAMNETVTNSTNQFEDLENIFRYYVYPCVYFTILAIGVVGNGTLLLMFARHKEIRTGPNVMVLNLAVTDVLNLFINTPLYYVSKFYSKWIYLEGYGCKLFVIFRFAIHSVLTFSIVALSVQRYCATLPTFRRVSASWGISSHLKTFIYVTSVWVAALLCGVPTAVVFEYKNGICFPYVKYQVAVEVLDIFYFVLFVFFLPIIMIVFSVLTARRLRMSVRSIPGVIRNNSQEISRYRSAKVVTSLAIAYCVSHIPRSIWFFMLTFFHFSRRENMFLIFVDEITNYLMFSNSCLNPVALYLASASFRRLFKLYLCRSVPNSGRKIVPLNRQATATSQNSVLMTRTETFSSDLNTSKLSLFEYR